MHQKMTWRSVTVAAVVIIGISGGSAAAVPQTLNSKTAVIESDEEVVASGRIPESDKERAAIWDSFRADIAPFVDDGDTGVVVDASGKPSSFASFVTQPKDLHADLYWVGEVPSALRKVLDGHPKVDVQIHESTHSLADLIAGKNRISNGVAPEGIKFVTVGPAPDATAVVVRAEPSDRDTLTEAEVRAVQQQLEDVAGVPVQLNLVDKGWMSPAGSRQSDTSPFSGSAGLAILRPTPPGNEYCSSGVSVVGRSTGSKYMTTAYHCLYWPGGGSGASGEVRAPASGNLIGEWKRSTGRVEANRDAALIKVADGKNNVGDTYWGSSYNSSITHPIDGYEISDLGEEVCLGGANSGTRCGTVDEKNFDGWNVNGTKMVNLVTAARTGSGFLLATGDSGGPVYKTRGPNHYLKGFIGFTSGGSYSRCGSGGEIYNFNSLIECANRVVYIGGVGSYLDALNVNLR